MMNNGCETGCITYTGGEKRHDKNCQYYPESLTKMYDDLLNEVKNLRIHNVMPCELEFKASLTLLRDLADIQNDAPLERDRKEWTEIMKSTYEFLDAHEA